MSHSSFVCFGELLLRLDSNGYERIIQSESFRARYTGAEANVAVSLASFGCETYSVSLVPDNEIGQACINYLQRYGVNTRNILKKGDRLGILFVETGASQRSTKVIYDRKHSSITEVSINDFNWNNILPGKSWFHFSGTAAALGSNVVDVIREALKTAKKLGITTSCDINYRSKLWSMQEAGNVLSELMKDVDVFIGGIEDPQKIFGVTNLDDIQIDSNNHIIHGAKGLTELFGCKYVALTLRDGSSASNNSYSGMIYHGNESVISKEYDIQIIDRIGAGDAFTAGIIYQLMRESDLKTVVEYATAAACLKHTIPGDFNLSTVKEVEMVMYGGHSGRVQR